jgi:hypothetical protein
VPQIFASVLTCVVRDVVRYVVRDVVRYVVTSAREGRDGVNPSSTHLLPIETPMCRQGPCALATLAVASRQTVASRHTQKSEVPPPSLRPYRRGKRRPYFSQNSTNHNRWLPLL